MMSTPIKSTNDASFERTRVTFQSGGVSIAGYLYRPTHLAGSLPCVVMANGFSGTMDWILPTFAERFAAAGFAALIFDYRYFGESEGQPRQLIDIKQQRDDLRAAIAFARRAGGIDPQRVVLWGTSLVGGNVFEVAADDPEVAAVIAQVPGFDMVSKEARATIKLPASQLIKLLAAAVRDAIHGALGLPPYYAKVFGRPDEAAVFTDPALKPRIDALMAGSPTWRNEFTPRFYLNLPRYQPGTAERLKMPLMVCIADREVYGNPVFQAKIGHLAPRGEVFHYEAEHFDFYHGIFDQVVSDEIDFLRRHLVP